MPRTKSETLEFLQGRTRGFSILPQVRHTVAQWRANPDGCLEKIHAAMPRDCTRIIVRSSAINEDTETTSNAGCYSSVGDVSLDPPGTLRTAVETVIRSYGDSADDNHQFFVQPFLADVSMSGVISTREMDTLAPYYVINYDNTTGRTDTVTSGTSEAIRTQVVFRGARSWPEGFEALLVAVFELEKILGSDSLDIEFAIDRNGAPVLLQVRPIVRYGHQVPAEENHAHYLNKIHKKISKLIRPHPHLHGSYTILGVMPDWNPAEIIGTRPRTLSLSLYKYLITDRTWAYQRNNYGYADLRSFPLLVSLTGFPYIDVRASFNSFVPKDIDKELALKIVEHYLDRLRKNRQFHDKVEFDIVLSCFTMDIDGKLRSLEKHGFTPGETCSLRKSLIKLTDSVMAPDESVLLTDLAKIESLRERQTSIINSHMPILDKIYWLLEDCCRWGTLPFAGIARAGFIAVQMLHSFVSRGWITTADFDNYMSSLNTVARMMNADRSSMDKNAFLEKFGHLRPGTYDILSPRYDEAYDLYFGTAQETSPPACGDFTFTDETLANITRTLEQENFSITKDDLLVFLKRSIEGREYAKFVFTRSVSEVLRLIGMLAVKYGLSPEDASFLDIRTLTGLYACLDHRDLADILAEEAGRNRRYYETTRTIKLPPVIIEPDDIYAFELEAGTPNFITSKRCKAEVLVEKDLLSTNPSGRIVCIQNADPGFDWIFSRPIAGMVTMYGGANSHMAIRAAELGIPAVIGAGEKLFARWSQANLLEIDCENKQVRTLR